MNTFEITLAAVFIIAFAIIVWYMIWDILEDFFDDPILNGAVIAATLCIVLWLLSVITRGGIK